MAKERKKNEKLNFNDEAVITKSFFYIAEKLAITIVDKITKFNDKKEPGKEIDKAYKPANRTD